MSDNPYQSPESIGPLSREPLRDRSALSHFIMGLVLLAGAVALLFMPVLNGRGTAAQAFLRSALVYTAASIACSASVTCLGIATYQVLRGPRR